MLNNDNYELINNHQISTILGYNWVLDPSTTYLINGWVSNPSNRINAYMGDEPIILSKKGKQAIKKEYNEKN